MLSLLASIDQAEGKDEARIVIAFGVKSFNEPLFSASKPGPSLMFELVSWMLHGCQGSWFLNNWLCGSPILAMACHDQAIPKIPKLTYTYCRFGVLITLACFLYSDNV